MSGHSKHQLGKGDLEELHQASLIFQSDDKTRQLAQQYILEYRHATSGTSSSSAVAKCGLFFAEKSQYICDIKGQRIQGIGLSLNQIIKTHPNIEEFVLILKDFLRRIRLPDLEVETGLHTIVEKISSGMTFYNKFEKILKDLNFTERAAGFGYLRVFSSFVWLLFIDARAEIYKDSKDMVKSTCLLATVFYIMVRYCLDYVKPGFLADVSDRVESNKQAIAKVIARITEKLLGMFSIQDYETYKLGVTDFDDYFQGLLGNNIIKNTNQKVDFFSPEMITMNYKRLDAIYQKRLSVNDLDQRLFLKDRTTTLTPSKVTPFQRQGMHSKGYKWLNKVDKTENLNPNVIPNKNFYSHRALEYELVDKDILSPKGNANPSNVSTVKELKLPKNVMFSPSMAKPTLICATPITLGMEMYNYIIEKPKIVKEAVLSKPYESSVQSWIDQFVPLKRVASDSIQDRKTKQMRANIISSLYKIAVEAYLREFPSQKDTEEVSKCFLALSAQTVCFVCNICNTSFEKIRESLSVNLLTLWKTNQFFYRFDKAMPSQIRSHFVHIQTRLVAFELWKKQLVVSMIQLVSSSDTGSNQLGERLLKRTLQYLVDQLAKLSVALKIKDSLSQQIFSTLKCLIAFQSSLLLNRHLDQLVICSLYALCKNQKIDIKFNDIKVKYEQLNPQNKSEHTDIMCNVDVGSDTNADIIKFYNTLFISRAKNYVKQDITGYFDRLNPTMKYSMQQVPPKDMFHTLKRVLKSKIGGVFGSETTMTKGISKKVLNYDEDQLKRNLHLGRIQEGEDEAGDRSPRKDRQPRREKEHSQNNDRIQNTVKMEAYSSFQGHPVGLRN